MPARRQRRPRPTAKAPVLYHAAIRTLLLLVRSAQPQGQLPGWAGVVFDETPDASRDRLAREVASFLNLFGDLSRDIAGPMLARVEGHHANRLIEIPAHEIGDHGCILGVCVYAAFEPIPRHSFDHRGVRW